MSDSEYLDIYASDVVNFVYADNKKFTPEEISDFLRQNSDDNNLLGEFMYHISYLDRDATKINKLVNLLLDAGFSRDMPAWATAIDIGVAFKERELRKREVARLLPTFNRAGRDVDVIIQEYDMTFRKNRKKSR